MRVELRDIRKHFGAVKANDGISIELEAGRVYGLLGENGAGKTTLMKVLSGFHKPDSGEIILDGEPAHFGSPAQAQGSGVGMIYQDPLDIPAVRVVENYLLGHDSQVTLRFAAAVRELKEYAGQLGFAVNPQEYIENLSLGERQQLELIRLLALGAQVLVLDEPTTGISAEQKELLFSSIRKLAKDEGKTVILVSHKLADVQDLCQHVIVLRRGKVVGQADVPCPTDELVRMMFEEIPPRSQRPSQVQEGVVLELHEVSITTEHLSLEPVDLVVRPGEVFGLAGLEGSGQRQLLQACARLIPVRGGQILLGSQNVTRWSYQRLRESGVAYVPAARLEEGLVPGLSLTEHVALTSEETSFVIDWPALHQETRRRIDRYQIVGRPETRVDALSGGNQQRTLYALLRSPLRLILLEHPTRGLDVRSAEWIWQLLFEHVGSGGAILYLSADLDELVERSDRIAAFSGGVMSRVVRADQATAEELGHLIGGGR
ncbi:MAG TPA: ATP-binding cassette domain-containing protein [Anaerolineales bacterium]|nr:ATP-binding cassette domain-containing protein [Anaerolineales bacterium]